MPGATDYLGDGGGGMGGLGFVEVYGEVLDSVIVGGQEFEGFLGNYGGAAIGSGETIDRPLEGRAAPLVRTIPGSANSV